MPDVLPVLTLEDDPVAAAQILDVLDGDVFVLSGYLLSDAIAQRDRYAAATSRSGSPATNGNEVTYEDVNCRIWFCTVCGYSLTQDWIFEKAMPAAAEPWKWAFAEDNLIVNGETYRMWEAVDVNPEPDNPDTDPDPDPDPDPIPVFNPDFDPAAHYSEVFSTGSNGDALEDLAEWADHGSHPSLTFNDGVTSSLPAGYIASGYNATSYGKVDIAGTDTTAVWAEMYVEQDGVNQALFVGIGGAFDYSLTLRIKGADWALRQNGYSVIESGTVAENIKKARIEVSATELRAIVDGVLVSSQAINPYSQYSNGTQPLMLAISRPTNGTAHDVEQNRIAAYSFGALT